MPASAGLPDDASVFRADHQVAVVLEGHFGAPILLVDGPDSARRPIDNKVAVALEKHGPARAITAGPPQRTRRAVKDEIAVSLHDQLKPAVLRPDGRSCSQPDPYVARDDAGAVCGIVECVGGLEAIIGTATPCDRAKFAASVVGKMLGFLRCSAGRPAQTGCDDYPACTPRAL
jgi:hypothetical protein